MIHPWKKLIEEIRDRNWTQKQFAVLVWKKNSEVNELIKWKRNITIQWDLILSEVLWTPEKYWINMQTDYDYEILKQEREKQKMEQKQEFEVVSDIPKENIQEVVSEDVHKDDPLPEDIQNDNEDIQNDDNVSPWTETITINQESLQGKKESIDENDVSLSQVSVNSDISQNNNEIEISEEERQKRKEMKKIFMNF